MGEAAFDICEVNSYKYKPAESRPGDSKKEHSIYFGIKRLADAALSQIAIIILSPFFLLTVLVTSGQTWTHCFGQISGRKDISFEKWIALDIEYLCKMSLCTDIKIISRTVAVVIIGKGAY